MTRRDDPDGVGAQLERLSTLAGTKGNPLDQAVRIRDLKGRVLKIIEDREREQRTDTPANGERIADFQTNLGETSLPPGFYTWQQGLSRNIPPAGAGGGALLLKRSDEVAMWLAAVMSGTVGQNVPALFALATSGRPNDWGRWTELYHEGNTVSGPSYDGAGFGDLRKQETKQPTGPRWAFRSNPAGTILRSGSGLQICWRHDLTADFDSAASLLCTWTYPEPFGAPPIVIPILPRTTNGAYSGFATTDVGNIGVHPIETAAYIAVRRDTGASDFVSGDTLTGLMALAIGLWWDQP